MRLPNLLLKVDAMLHYIPSRLRRRMPSRFALLLAMVVGLTPIGAVALFQLGPTAPSPATGHAQVVAHGVSGLPAAELSWRIVVDTAEPREQAVAAERALGFVIADQAAILVNDQGLGLQQRLAGGEAAFVPLGSLQQRASLDAIAAPYYRFGLVPVAQASDTAGGRLVFAGSGWTAPPGEQFDLALIRDVVAPNEQATVPATNGPAAVLVTSGTIEVEAAGAAPVRLAADQAAEFTGELAIFGVGTEDATFVIATLGPEVPPPPAPPTGSISINVLACPPGVTPIDATAAGFAPTGAGDCLPTALPSNPVLILAGGEPLAPDQPHPEQGSYTWNYLLYSPFPVGDFTLPAGYDSYLLVDTANNIVQASENAGVLPTVPNPGLLFVDAQVPDAQATLYLFGAGGGSISLAPFVCPDGMTAELFDSSACQPASGEFAAEITALASGEVLGLAEATGPAGAYYTWSGLAPGDYTVDFPALPAGYGQFTIPGLTPRDPDETYALDLTQDVPDAQYNVFFFRDQDDAAASGTIAVSIFDCPPGMNRATFVAASCQPSTGFDLNLYPPTGGAYGMSNAAVEGHVVTWSNLPFAEYAIEEVLLPAGYVDAFAPGTATSDLSSRVYVVAVTEAEPRTGISIYNLDTSSSE